MKHTFFPVTCPKEDPDKPPTYFPHETECGKFYECSGGKAFLFTCPHGSYWNQSETSCDYGVNCGNLKTSTYVPPTPTQPPTTKKF